MTANSYPWFVKRDLDGFFGLFIDNIVQMLLIVVLCGACGIGPDSPLLLQAILPGAAVSILFGNIFYAWQARRLARRTGRNDVTALPYGINTPSLLVFIFFVMLPAYSQAVERLGPEAAARLAWQMGLIACLGSGVIECAGSLAAETVRRNTPRAALLSTLAGIAIGFISMKFALEIFQRPLVAMLPLAVVLLTLFSRVGFPLGLPGGFVAVVLGTLCAWILPQALPADIAGPPMETSRISAAWSQRGFYWPQFYGGELWETLSQPREWLGYLSVIVPMGLFNLIGSLQNIESAEAAGDPYSTRSSLAANGVGTIAAALFGSCFPTTIYIGHPGWKGLGARAGYSTLNGLVITVICLTGTVGLLNSIVPLEAGIAIVLWIGVVITAQAFQVTPHEHAPAVAIGLFPAIAAWGCVVAQGAFLTLHLNEPQVQTTLESLLAADRGVQFNGFLLHGLIVMERGYIFTCMFLAAISAFLIDRKFFTAAAWSLVAALFAAVGLTHSYQISGDNFDFLFIFSDPHENWRPFRAYGIALGYLMFAGVFVAFGVLFRGGRVPEQPAHH